MKPIPVLEDGEPCVAEALTVHQRPEEETAVHPVDFVA